jgi:hypothetical protein
VISLFDRKPGPRAAILAEARSLMDDGLTLDFVIDLFPEDAEWLRPALALTASLTDSYTAEPASFFFEAELKAKFLAAADNPRVPAPAAPPATAFPFKTAVTTLTLASAAAAAGVVTLGFVTAGGAVPGDWNYSFKLAGERLQYALSRGDQRVNIQIGQAEARVYEIQQLSQKGDVSTSDISRLQDEVQAIASLAQAKPLDDVQKARLQGVAQTSQVVLNDTKAKQPSLGEPVVAAGEAIHAAVVMALAATPVPTATATTTTTASATATLTPATTPSVTTTPTPTETTAPTKTATPEPTATATETPPPSATAAPSSSATAPPSAAATESTESQATATPPPGAAP